MMLGVGYRPFSHQFVQLQDDADLKVCLDLVQQTTVILACMLGQCKPFRTPDTNAESNVNPSWLQGVFGFWLCWAPGKHHPMKRGLFITLSVAWTLEDCIIVGVTWLLWIQSAVDAAVDIIVRRAGCRGHGLCLAPCREPHLECRGWECSWVLRIKEASVVSILPGAAAKSRRCTGHHRSMPGAYQWLSSTRNTG